MTPDDRSAVIEAIRHSLKTGEKITVVSTSLIEAGVDPDFRAVFREMAGLDNILRSGGRCNREGSFECGNVYIFNTDSRTSPDMKAAANIVSGLLEEYDDISSPECIREYYLRLFKINDKSINENSICNPNFSGQAHTTPQSIPFRTFAQNFRMIKEETIGIVIRNCPEAAELYEKLREGRFSVKRSLQKYTVSLAPYEFENAMRFKIIDDFGTGVYTLTDTGYYSPTTGLDLDLSDDIIL